MDIKIRASKPREVGSIKKLVDSSESLDTEEDTYTEEYFERLIDEGILLVAVENEKGEADIVGACFGTYSSEEGWADLIGVVVHESLRREGIGKKLVKEFEREASKEDVSTIDLFADKSSTEFFDKLGYERGREYVAYRKML